MAYQPNPGMVIVPGGGGNRNARNMPIGPNGRKWSNGLCDCFGDIGTCLTAWCFPCITYANIKHRYEHLQGRGFPDPEGGGSLCNGDCFVHCAIIYCCGAGWVLQTGQRSRIRQRYNIRGNGCGDCCAAFWCSPCELTQESRELELEELSFQGQVQPYVVGQPGPGK